jgi:hypothetical protein
VAAKGKKPLSEMVHNSVEEIIMPDYYGTLGVRQDTHPDEIKKSYRRLARELHPDVNPDPQTQELFKEITQAYEVLSDLGKRQLYDQGEDPFQRGGTGGFGNGGDDFRTVCRADTALDDLEGMRGISLPGQMDYAVKHGRARLVMDVIASYDIRPAKRTLKYVVQKGWADYVEAFIQAGTKPTRKMLAIATHNHDAKIVNLLLNAGVRPDQEMLLDAVRQKWPSCVRAFINKGAVPTQEMLNIARDNNATQTIEILQAALAHAAEPSRRRFRFRQKQRVP